MGRLHRVHASISNSTQGSKATAAAGGLRGAIGPVQRRPAPAPADRAGGSSTRWARARGNRPHARRRRILQPHPVHEQAARHLRPGDGLAVGRAAARPRPASRAHRARPGAARRRSGHQAHPRIVERQRSRGRRRVSRARFRPARPASRGARRSRPRSVRRCAERVHRGQRLSSRRSGRARRGQRQQAAGLRAQQPGQRVCRCARTSAAPSRIGSASWRCSQSATGIASQWWASQPGSASICVGRRQAVAPAAGNCAAAAPAPRPARPGSSRCQSWRDAQDLLARRGGLQRLALGRTGDGAFAACSGDGTPGGAAVRVGAQREQRAQRAGQARRAGRPAGQQRGLHRPAADDRRQRRAGAQPQASGEVVRIVMPPLRARPEQEAAARRAGRGATRSRARSSFSTSLRGGHGRGLVGELEHRREQRAGLEGAHAALEGADEVETPRCRCRARRVRARPAAAGRSAQRQAHQVHEPGRDQHAERMAARPVAGSKPTRLHVAAPG